MAKSGWSEGLTAAYAFFASLPKAAQDEAKQGIAELSVEALILQRAAAPYRSGNLKNALSIKEATTMLRARVGYPEMRGKKSKTFYAIWMEYGRRAQTVWVRRLNRGARKDWKARIAGGRASSRAKPNDLLNKGGAFPMKVTALPARPFVHQESQLESAMRAFEQRFWDEALRRAEGAA